MTATTLRLSDLAGPDADGWSDVAVFVRADGSESEPFVVMEVFAGGGVRYQQVKMPEPYVTSVPWIYPVRRLNRGRLRPARIERQGEAGAEEKLREAIRDAGFAVMQTSGKWSIVMVTDEAKRQRETDEQHAARIINENIDLAAREYMLKSDITLLREALEALLNYTVACEGLLNASEAKQCGDARAALAATEPKPTEDVK